MSAFEHPSFDEHEYVLFATDPETQLKALIAVHSTARGPATGGCRLWKYPDSTAAMEDVLRLSKGMSYKNAMADLPLGGGKSVIMRPEGDWDRDALFQAFGRAIEALNGLYITAEDVGVSPDDMMNIHKETDYVVGLPEGEAASGDPSPLTAEGVFKGIGVCVKHAYGRDDLEGVRVAVQGVGHVGEYTCSHLHKAGAELIITDVNEEALERVSSKYGAKVVKPDAIYDQDVDVFAPCALGGVVNPDTIDRLKGKVVAGAANNVLATPDMGEALRKRGILYAPDYVINAGGIINVAGEVKGAYDLNWVRGKLETLAETVAEVIRRSESEDRPTNQVADDMAREILAAAAAKKKG